MIISKSQGEKLDDNYMKIIYGKQQSCGGNCGNCDCTKSNGALFYNAFDPEISSYQKILEAVYNT